MGSFRVFVHSYCLDHGLSSSCTKKCSQSVNFQFDIISPSDPTRLLCQMQANSSGDEFLSTISKFMKRMNFVIDCLRPSQNVKLGIFTVVVQLTAKKCTKKRDARAKLLFCLVKLLRI